MAQTDQVSSKQWIPAWLKYDLEHIREALKKNGYAYIVLMVLQYVGIDRMSAVIKAIAKVQKVLNAIMGDLNQLKRLLEALQGEGFGYASSDDSKGGTAPDKTPLTPTKYRWDPSKHTEKDNEEQMNNLIMQWLDMTTKDSNGKQITNYQALQDVFKDLFITQIPVGGTKTNPITKTGQLGALDYALKNPDYVQQDGLGYQSLAALNTDEFKGTGEDWKGSSTFYKGPINLLTFLRDEKNENGNSMGSETVASIMRIPYCFSYYSKTGEKPTDAKSSYNNDVGDVTGQFENTKQVLNGLNTSQSSDLSMYSQNLTSEINIGQQCLQKYGKETETYTSHQSGR